MAGFEYPVDVVLVIDATDSMRDIIQRVKARALQFHDDLRVVLAREQRHVSSLRVRVIVSRDLYVDGQWAIQESPFYQLPAQQVEFSQFVDSITAMGGGDEPETTLEALALAMGSDWVGGVKKRHVIAVWTDASAHPLDKSKGSKPAVYPGNMPADFDDLTDMWEGEGVMDNSAKRLVLYAPDDYAWTDIAAHWENVIHHTSKAGQGLSEVDYETILTVIAQSVA